MMGPPTRKDGPIITNALDQTDLPDEAIRDGDVGLTAVGLLASL